MLNFLKHLTVAGGAQMANQITTELVKLAPETASAAQLSQMEEDLDKVGNLITDLRRELTEEQAAYDAVNARYTQMMGAAERLQSQIDTEADPARKASLEASLAALVAKIEEVVPEVDSTKHEVDETRAALKDTEAAYQEKASALTRSKGELERAKNDMHRAEIEEQRAAQRAERARQVAGLTKNGTDLTTATDVFKAAAAQSRAAAQTHDMKAKALRQSDAVSEDPNIAAAMSAAAGKPTDASIKDRLAALKR
jgi:chromosome segregation ATPase